MCSNNKRAATYYDRTEAYQADLKAMRERMLEIQRRKVHAQDEMRKARNKQWRKDVGRPLLEMFVIILLLTILIGGFH